MFAAHVVVSLWITETLWFAWIMRGLALDPLWRRLGLDGDDLE